jgi:hypothetical protein
VDGGLRGGRRGRQHLCVYKYDDTMHPF